MLCKLIDFTYGLCTEYYSGAEYIKMVSRYGVRSWKPMPGVDYQFAKVVIRTSIPIGTIMSTVATFPNVDASLKKGQYHTFPSGDVSSISVEDYCDQWLERGATWGRVNEGRIEVLNDEDTSRVDL